MIVAQRLRAIEVKNNVSVSVLEVVAAGVLLLDELLKLPKNKGETAYLLVFVKTEGSFAVFYCFKVLVAWEFGGDLGHAVVVGVFESQVS